MRIKPLTLSILAFMTLMSSMSNLCMTAIAQSAPQQEPDLSNYTRLEQDPITIDSIGLSLNIPKGAQAETVRIGTTTSTGIAFPADLGTMIVKEQRTTNPELTAKSAIESIKQTLLQLPGSQLIAEQPELRVGIWNGHRIYVTIANPTPGGPPLFRGITIFGYKPSAFLIFDYSLEAPESMFDQGRVLYETSIGTMNLQEMSTQTLKRAAGFQATNSLLDQLTLEDYDAVLTGPKSERWERLFTPAASGDVMDAKEHGYRRMKSWSGYKGEVGNKDKSKWTAEDRKLGYLMQIDSMALDNGLRIDSRALFFMSLDGNEELWTIRMTLKGTESKDQGSAGMNQDSTVTGARIGGKLSVTTAFGTEAPTTVSPFIPETGYITQVQAYLLGALIVHKELQGDFATYAYNPVTNTVALRWDISEQPSHSPGMWTVTEKTSPNSPPTTTLYNANGDFMRVRLTNGRLWEPIELDRLISLWKRKGLPLQ